MSIVCLRPSGGSDAQKVDQAFTCLDRTRRAGRRSGLDCAGTDRILIMTYGEKPVRVILILVCLALFVPVVLTALARIVRLEAGAGWKACRNAITRAWGS